MKANDKLLKKAAELGILRSMPDFLKEPLKPGRLKRLFMEIGFIVDVELRKIYNQNPNFFKDNKDELIHYLDKFGRITCWGNDKSYVHVASVVAFCLAFLEGTKSNYNPKLVPLLVKALDYYERQGNLNYSDLWTGDMFNKKWDALHN